MAFKQAHRMMAVQTALGEDKLLLVRMRGQERLSQMFSYELVMQSEDGALDFKKVLGKNMTVRLEPAGDATTTRYFNGICSRFQQCGSHAGLTEYRATMVPKIWLLTRTSDCRIYQHMTAQDIIRSVLQESGFNDIEFNITGSLVTRDYTVQYRETYFNFISRIMEDEGIFYYFRHENGKHTLVMSDALSVSKKVTDFPSIPFGTSTAKKKVDNSIYTWEQSQTVQSMEYMLTDYFYENSSSSLRARSNQSIKEDLENLAMFDYPGGYEIASDGGDVAARRLEELQCQFETHELTTGVRQLEVGRLFKLTDHPRSDQNVEYAVLGTDVKLFNTLFRPEGSESFDQEPPYFCSATVVPKTALYRPPRLTPKPVIQGPQTAVVVGNDEIWTDKFGRVQVMFHWDRYAKAKADDSCWIRVAQSWAGKKWGTWFLPRVGHEVVVEFLEGDPDRPLVTGSVYNDVNTVPYELPANKTRSTIKSSSSTGGAGFNEIRLEDKKGDEEFFIHAQKDYNKRVEEIRREDLGKDGHLLIGGDLFEEIKGDKHQKVKGDHITAVDGDHHETVKGSRNTKIKTKHSLDVSMDQMVKVGMNANLKAGANINIQATAKYGLKALGVDIKGDTTVAIEAGMMTHIKGGMSVVVEAGLTISLKAGPSFVVIGPDGVSIMGPMVKICSGGAAMSGPGAKPQAPAAPEAPDSPKPPETVKGEAGQTSETKADPFKRKKIGDDSTKVGDYTPPSAGGGGGGGGGGANEEKSEQAEVLEEAAEAGAPFCEECEAAKKAEEEEAEAEAANEEEEKS